MFTMAKHQSAGLHLAIFKALGLNRRGARHTPEGHSKAAWAELLAEAHYDGGKRLRRCTDASASLSELAKTQFGDQVFGYNVEGIARGLELTIEDAIIAIRLCGAVERAGLWVSDTNGPPVGVLRV